ncbi:MAG: hypothetical protein ABSF62_02375 [Bryobacteraceae bacterium]
MAIRGRGGIAALVLACGCLAQTNQISPVEVLPTRRGTTGGEWRLANPAQTYYSGFVGGAATADQEWTLPTSDAAGCWMSNGSHILSIGSCSGVPGGATTNVQTNISGALHGDANFTWDPVAQLLTARGIASTAAIVAVTGFVQSPGFLSNANSWQGFNSQTDGALLRGYHVDANVAGTAGGYMDIAPIAYSPSPGYACYDKWGNPVSLPLPLNGLSAYGANDMVLWNSTSPLPGYHAPWGTPGVFTSGVPCATPVPVPSSGQPYGINTNGYIFARGGFASDQVEYNSVQIFTGGIQAGSVYTSAFYPAGTVTHCCGTLAAPQYIGGVLVTGLGKSPPAVGTIATVDNPFPLGLGQEAGETYWDTTLGCQNWSVDANPAHWYCMVLSGGNFQVNAAGDVSAVNLQLNGGGGTGVNVAVNTAYNSIQTVGGFLAAGTSSSGYSFTVGTTAVIGNSGAFVGPSVTTSGTITSSNTGTNITFQNAGGNFQVNGNGAISTVGTVAANGGLSSGTATAYNSVQAPSGGMGALSFTAAHYVQTGYGSSAPSPTTSDSFHPGTLYYDTSAGCEEVYSGSSFGCVGSSGSAPSFTATNTGTSITFQNSGGNFQVNGNGAVSAVGVFSSTGASGGFNATTSTAYNSIQTTGGFLAAGTSSTGYSFTVGAIPAIDNSGNFVGPLAQAGEFTATHTGSSLAFRNSSGNFSVDGNGNISTAGVITSSGSSGGIDVTGASAYNSIQTNAGILAQSLSLSGVFREVSGVATVGQGVPWIPFYLSGTAAAYTGSLPLSYGGGTAPAGLYRISWYASIYTGSTTAATVQCAVTDGTGYWYIPPAQSSIPDSSGNSFQAGSDLIHLDGTHMPTCSVSMGTGSPTIGYAFTLERLQ